MKRVKLWLRSYFGFSQRETNGFLFLLLIVVAAAAAPFLFNRLNQSAAYNPLQDQLALDSLAALLDRTTPAENYAARKTPETSKAAPVRLHRFNPNTATAAELMAVGISRYAAGNIIKYRAKAGDFRYKEQLQRIYGLPEALYQQLYPYIDLPAREASRGNFKQSELADNRTYSNRPDYKPERKANRLQPFDINTADTTELKKIRGIGTKLSARIINFRNKLGGFAQPAQLAEVYGLSPEIVDSLHKYTYIQAGFAPRTLALNASTFDELRAHPYVGFNLARLIIAYRTQHGAFTSTEEIKNIKIVNEATYQRLKPYLSL
ncbi:ComEA family DNA-binding protein [Adhaeribacter rhizoryzae]|uniref:Helix-hairpin-helix domain-containing protein n=1 Tax=Adhaeribacter rhizoryzae TaxID=2607907 RepID=A0A5M6DPT9_9BACT|nr:helix-hairpin-helix domain-containing protein [Adhaeribacter rhizoryzae]KAA5549498.1 helix-hairpin-helix domain-containing protein [Adhaeribacter rhizoryzae]